MKSKNKPLTGRRFLSKNVVESILTTTTGPEFAQPICIQDSAIHVVGSSAALLAIRAMQANVNFLRNQVDVCHGELSCESEFTASKLEEHIAMLGNLSNLIHNIVSHRRPDRPAGANILAKVLEELPAKSGNNYRSAVKEVTDILDAAIKEMVDILSKTWANKETNSEDEICGLLHKTALRLSRLSLALRKLEESMEAGTRCITNDWTTNVRQIHRTPTCAREK